jgi:hypothetical protein
MGLNGEKRFLDEIKNQILLFSLFLRVSLIILQNLINSGISILYDCTTREYFSCLASIDTLY